VRRRAFAFAAALGVGASCGPVAGPPPSPLTVNACPEHPCSGYASAEPPTCTNGICVAGSDGSNFDFTLVVSLPELSFYGAGITVPIRSFRAALTAQCNLSNSTSYCLQIPTIVEPQGELLVERSVVESADAGTYIDTSEDAGTPISQWSLPIQVHYRPMWPPPDPTFTTPPVYVEAASIGLPLDPVQSSVGPPTFSTSGIGAPRGATPLEWRAPLWQPGTYERDIVPDNSAFPPVTMTISAANDSFSSAIPSAAQLTVSVAEGNVSLQGFNVYLRDATTLRRVSSEATLGDSASQSVTLLTSPPPFGAPFAPGAKLEVVVSPPEGYPIPYLADPILLDPSGNPLGTSESESFPALPSPVTVSGTVAAPDLTTVGATLVIDSIATTGSTGGITTLNPDDPAQPFVHYSTTARTDATGEYTVTLPPGTYDVFVTPAVGTRAAAGSVPLVVASPLGTEPPVATGKTLQAPALGILAGTATVADGRPLAGAIVQAQAAVSLAATLDPRRWPRTQTTTTDANGVFAMFVDPGTYDVVVQPVPSTGLPWTTLSSQVVTAGQTLTLAPLLVPAPVSIDLVLHDPLDNNLVQTLVRAFAPASGATSPTPGGPLPVIEIGSWLTDASGHITMLLAPPK